MEVDVDDDAVKDLIITGVKPIDDRELDQWQWHETLFSVDYNGVACTAKRQSSSFLALCSIVLSHRNPKEIFLQECLLHSKLRHSNIVKMSAVYYPNAGDQSVLPVLVMEPMKCTLSQLLQNYGSIPMYVKLSILQDVSRGICYLHTRNPPTLHCDLKSDNILLTTSLVAKVYNFENSIFSSLSGKQVCPGTIAVMPPEAFDDHHYGLPLDVFSFGCLVCDVITSYLLWSYEPSSEVLLTPDYAIKKRKHSINQISEGSLRQLVINCLDNDPERRPLISVVSDRITSIITG